MIEIILYAVIGIGIIIWACVHDLEEMSLVFALTFLLILMLVGSLIDSPTVTTTEYPITQVSDTFVVYEIDGVEYSEELTDANVKLGKSNVVEITETTYDESKFINAITFNIPETEIKIYLKLGE